MLVSQFIPGKGLIAYSASCCLRFCLLISLYLGNSCDLPFGDTDDSWYILGYLEPIGQRWWLREMHSFEGQPELEPS